MVLLGKVSVALKTDPLLLGLLRFFRRSPEVTSDILHNFEL